jgi:hypothetical protein
MAVRNTGILSFIMYKIKLSLSLIKHHAIQTCEGVEVCLYTFLTSELDQGELRFHTLVAFPH